MRQKFAESKRSWLFCPANQPGRVQKAVASAAHAVIIDLEDAVPVEEKDSARVALCDKLETVDHPSLYVRINALDTSFAFEDVKAVMARAISGIFLPKSECARDIAVLDWLINQMERRNALEHGSIEIIPLIESAVAFENLPDICKASARIKCLAFGAADFTFDLGLIWSRDEQELMLYRSSLVLASRQAGIEAPIDTPWIDISDQHGMARSAQRSRSDGFQGKLCIHPKQIEVINQTYALSQAQVDEARHILAAFEAAGSSAIKVNGKMIDYPIVERARHILVEAEKRATFRNTRK